MSAALTAGRELNALVAEKVMGWKWVRNIVERCDSYYKPLLFPIGFAFLVSPDRVNERGYSGRFWAEARPEDSKADRFDYFVPKFSTGIQESWAVLSVFDQFVVCKNRNGDISVEVAQRNPPRYGAVWPEEHVKDLPLAICVAALQAIEQKAT